MANNRIELLRKRIKAENLDGMVINHLDYIRYLTGFTGTAGLLIILHNSAHFFTDSRYTVQAAKQVTGAKVVTVSAEPISSLNGYTWLHKKNLRLGFDGQHLTVAQQARLKEKIPEVLLTPAESLLEELGWVKDNNEIASTKAAVEIADVAFGRILQMIRPGIRERELAAELEYQMAMQGSERPAFESIVASGYRSALPHGIASQKKVQKGDFITLDFGATINGYVSDITRTVVVGKASPRQRKIYEIVLKAQNAGIRAVKAGRDCKKVDSACRSVIKRAGFSKNFGHGTGHGIGFYIHVGPRIGPRSIDKLAVNHIVTIEPGIYVPGWGGVRIEDDVLVTRGGGLVLNRAPKNLLEL